MARSNAISDYVKNGCDTATVSVEVYDNDDEVDIKTTIFQRTFDISNKSKFSVNEQSVNKKTFLETISKYKIQISNLCQFLPQDKVQV